MQQPRIAVLPLLAAALLTACGGGDTAAPSASLSVAAAPREQAQAVTPEDAARQLLDFAEGSVFKSYFPSHPDTQTFGPFRFRYYPATGVYLGVVVAADATYKPVGAVYVMGGSFGAAPTYVGLLTDFMTPVDNGGGTVGANNGCYDLAMMDTPGTRWIVDYRFSGRTTGTGTMDWAVGELKTFEGNNGYETTFKSTNTLTAPEASSSTVDEKHYGRRTGEVEVTNYGTESIVAVSLPGVTGTMTTKGIYSPPWVSRLAGIPLGGTLSESWTMVATTSTVYTGIPVSLPPTTSTTSSTVVTTYVSNETITVPAGTYSTCRFDAVVAGAPAGTTQTQWVLRGRGLPVKFVFRQAGVVDSVQEATSITLNGSRL